MEELSGLQTKGIGQVLLVVFKVTLNEQYYWNLEYSGLKFPKVIWGFLSILTRVVEDSMGISIVSTSKRMMSVMMISSTKTILELTISSFISYISKTLVL